MIFNSGNNTMGIMDVTGMGRASVTHQIPIKSALAAIFLADNGILESGINKRTTKNTTSPVIKP
jgi:hypothetical protein